MASVLLEYDPVITGPDGIAYRARACGSQLDAGMWQGWIEFLPPKGGKVLLSPRETTRPGKDSLMRWASGLTPAYLEGALGRAIDRTPIPKIQQPPASPRVSDLLTR